MDINSLHLSKEDPAVAEYMAAKAVGETVELKVTGQIRDIGDAGVTVDIISAEPTDYMGEPELEPTDEAEAGLIGEIM